MVIDEFLKIAIERDASDLHFKAGNHPMIRVHGTLTPLTGFPRLTTADCEELSNQMMTDFQRKRLREEFDIDLAYSLPGFGRFRGSIYYQRGSLAIALRIIPLEVKTIRQLLLPEVLEKVAFYQRGLVLVTGTTGSGKTTTLAAMIEYINTFRRENILTIEDPIEYLYKDKKSIIAQREVGPDTMRFANALRASFRQDPDVILIGEIRDQDTMETAMSAADTGHLVMSTLHTMNAVETISRILSFFPPHQHQQVRLVLSSVLVAVISLRLLPKKDAGGRIPAAEIMINNAATAEYILNPEKSHLIMPAMAEGYTQYGSQTFDQSLLQLYRDDLITFQVAKTNASNPDDFELKVKGVEGTSDRRWGG